MNPTHSPSFPRAQQAQIIRSNQRDVFQVSSLREQTENVIRSYLGTRWLTRWEKEVDVLVNLVYYGFTTRIAMQSLGEEYTDIWQHSIHSEKPLSQRHRAALVFLPTLASYIISRCSNAVPQSAKLGSVLRRLPKALELLSEVNLAIFYIRGTYYSLTKRVLGVRYISSTPDNPNARPPSYSLLGVLLAIRLMYRLITFVRTIRASNTSDSGSATVKGKQVADVSEETFIDDRPVSAMLSSVNPEGEPPVPAEEDEYTILDISRIPENVRAGRNCTLCLEERTASCATECGHLFCWNCIVGWGREKAECPLCRQSLDLTRLLPIYNL
ncbi:hypothetical protein CERSUDRAFT_146687 [Gelatoporia subvermispora B]|uniref:RING-type E3 ubiquitin transferase n=1 Tax=Ceriporiopsis subvermispora (strain B) TaxID=914234 RepID=M2QWU4_CERS8|nr:hypothetical protein CERSUDRAFT_146687 [Gelatoporia subvermispora B]